MKMVPRNVNKSSKGNRTNGNKEKNTSAMDTEEKNEEDRSILRQPMDIGIRGVKDLMKALAGGTTELQDLLLNECSVIYECKICCNLFRSLANFISHKRVYCVKSYCYFANSFNNLQNENQPEFVNNDVTVIPDMPSQNEPVTSDTNVWVTSDKTCNDSSEPVDGLRNMSPRRKLDAMKLGKKRDITEIVAGLSERGGKEVVRTSEDVPGSTFYSDIAERVMMQRNTCQRTVVELENVNDSCSSVFQTLKGQDYDCSVDSMKTQLIDLNRVVSKNQAILQKNGKFKVTSQHIETEEEKNLEKHKCSFCDSSFLTEQTLSRHVQIYHRERICYPCPLCRTFFPSPNSVYRHLTKAHHRTEPQIRRLRPQIFSKARKRKLLPAGPKVIPNIYDDSRRSKREAEEWINNFEGALRCNGCGKLFNRRAVLSVHSATCPKKAALLNNPTSQPSGKVKGTSQNPKSTVKQVLPLRNSKPVISQHELPKSGILVRKDYCKTVNTLDKPHISSLLTEADKNCSWDSKSWKPVSRGDYPTNFQSEVNTKSNSWDIMSTSSDSNSVSLTSSTKKSVKKKSDSLSKVDSIKKSNEKGTKKNFEVTPMEMQGISVKN